MVIAGNAYHDLDRRLRGILFPVRSYIVATEPLAPDVAAAINPRDLAVCDPNFVLQYFRLSADRRLLFGARFNYLGEDPAVIERHHRREIAKLWPRIADVRIDYAWGGNIGVPVNRVPQFGRLSPKSGTARVTRATASTSRISPGRSSPMQSVARWSGSTCSRKCRRSACLSAMRCACRWCRSASCTTS